jgi:ribosomal protein uS7
MMHGRNSGKKLMAVRIVKHAFDIIKLTTESNPVQILVDAIINGGPREDATRIGSAGVVRRQAVDVSPMRRVNQALYLLTTGAREAAFRNIKTIAECLADELINAAKGSSNRCATSRSDILKSGPECVAGRKLYAGACFTRHHLLHCCIPLSVVWSRDRMCNECEVHNAILPVAS